MDKIISNTIAFFEHMVKSDLPFFTLYQKPRLKPTHKT
ncbi:uncharacterized protein G2W53_028419 [Senna tora]|uniref:Uncharacterized protein n=1 Tax=Senna tora TaxID=362788 RepID=A0A834T2N7_9FABA|nr:uncharacterized protein G2W53_028419 [Senna tora]